ncbi:YHYH domain-containing protein [Brevibacillus laterosporus]|uniref:YHYH domain-containing protein n=1 Tax=Brevibacillus laterosporus TaxID=1465 RepID=UPI000EAC2538|nr:YHYH domain-containing protein [Brevibacillus laterosporus]AYK07659.1 YHYH domain-containing protein [Brevibacillus laterosporus]
MKKALLFFLFVTMLAVPFQQTSAHPGRTDKNGGHTCRTNCEKWGLSYGEYHYHNGGSSSSTKGTSPTKAKAPSKSTAPTVKPAGKAPVVQKKTIVAVDQAPVYSAPATSATVSTTLWYGYEVKDKGGSTQFASLEQGYLSKTLLTQYTVISPKKVSIQADKGYFYATPSTKSKARGSAPLHAEVSVVGENQTWYYGSSKDSNGNVVVGFISKNVAY